MKQSWRQIIRVRYAPGSAVLEIMTGLTLLGWGGSVALFGVDGSPTETLARHVPWPWLWLVPMLLGGLQFFVLSLRRLDYRRHFALGAFSWWLLVALMFGMTSAKHAVPVYLVLALQEWVTAFLLELRIGSDAEVSKRGGGGGEVGERPGPVGRGDIRLVGADRVQGD